MQLAMLFLMIAIAGSVFFLMQANAAQTEPRFAIVIHGGAGTITRANMTPEKEAAYRAKLEEALKTGHRILAEGGTSLDACIATVKIMEDSPLFNAGVGSVYTADEKHELDAAVMDGSNLKAGAVAAVTRIKNPIELARLVMDRSEHVLLVGVGAEEFAREQGVGLVENSYFDTPRRLEELRKKKAEKTSSTAPASQPDKHGTVGAVALDKHGNLAAATSTGGMTNKRFGRVGDTPLIGAGTWADNETCAVSATGHGEFLMRLVIAHEISSMMKYAKMPVREAASGAIDRLTKLGGTGGLIAIDRHGNITMPLNTEGMYRGYIDTGGKLVIEIYRD